MKSLVPECQCCGCAACAAVCKSGAIDMRKDSCGFARPQIIEQRCVDCGLCRTVCPVLNHGNENSPTSCFVARTKCSDVLLKSSSGGVFSELATRTIKDGGVVFGAGWGTSACNAVHKGIANLTELVDLRGSKYVQSDMQGIYEQIKDCAKAGRQVLFTGVPCQVAAVRNYLGRRYSNVLLVEVVCHGVPSPAVLDSYRKEIEIECGRKVSKFSFRWKKPGVKGSSLLISFSDGTQCRVENFAHSSYGRAFYANLSLRESCFGCNFRKGKSGADITIGDYWGVELHHKDYADGMGASLVLLRGIGPDVIQQLNLTLEPTEYRWLLPRNPNLEKDSKYSKKKRGIFWRNLESRGLKEAVELAMHEPIAIRVVAKTLRFIRRCCRKIVWISFGNNR